MIRKIPFFCALLATSALASLALSPSARAQEAEREAILAAIDDLADAGKAEAAIERLVAVGDPAVKHLLGEALEGADVASRGWAIVALSELGGEAAERGLTRLHENAAQPELVRTWAVAALVRMAKDTRRLTQLSNLAPLHPAIARPIALRLLAVSGGDPELVSTMLLLTVRHPQLTKALSEAILARGAAPLVDALLADPNLDVRRQAAACLGSLATRGEQVGPLMAEVTAFDSAAKLPPWEGGPLFLPTLAPWSGEDAEALTQNLVAWYFWAYRSGRADVKQQVINNLQSIGLGQVTKFWPGGRDDLQEWARNYGQAFGKADLERLLKLQRLSEEPGFKQILESLD